MPGDVAGTDAKGAKCCIKRHKGRAKTQAQDNEREGADTQAVAVGGAAVKTTPVAVVDLTADSDADMEQQRDVPDE